MDDVVFVGLLVALMGLASGYVRLCARIVGEVGTPAATTRGR